MLGITLSGCYAAPPAYLEGPTIPAGGDQLLLAGAPAAHATAPVASPPIVLASEDASPPDGSSEDASVPDGDTLTLAEAVRRARHFSPALHAAALEIDAKRG